MFDMQSFLFQKSSVVRFHELKKILSSSGAQTICFAKILLERKTWMWNQRSMWNKRSMPIFDYCHFQAVPALHPVTFTWFFSINMCFFQISWKLHSWKLTAGTRKSSSEKESHLKNMIMFGFHVSFLRCTFKPKIQYCSTFKIIRIAKTKGGAKTSRLLCFSTKCPSRRSLQWIETKRCKEMMIKSRYEAWNLFSYY